MANITDKLSKIDIEFIENQKMFFVSTYSKRGENKPFTKGFR
jgi:hypothetical protein